MVARRPFDVDQLLDRAVEIVCASAAAKRINIVASAAPAVPPRDVGDPDRVLQILINLLSNSVKCVRC